MAKQRSGLGRGLGSLLGGEPGGGLPQEAASPTERVVVKENEPSQNESKKNKEDIKKDSAKVEAPSKSESKKEDIYSSKEDNFTIKGVVEREVKTPKAPAPKRTASSLGYTKVREVNQELKQDDEVDIDLVEPNPYQPRTNFKKEELEELAESIRKNGLLQPLLVRKVDDKYQIIAGERRWQACKSIGMKTVPIRIKEAGDEDAIMLALVENIQRSNLNPIEEAYGYRRMMERGKMTQSEVAQAVSKGRTTITNALRLLELPEDAQKMLYEEKITAGHARAVLSVPSKDDRRKLIDKIVDEKLSVRDAERIARLLAGKDSKPKGKPRPQQPKSYKTVARALSDTLTTEVKIKSTNGKNKIEIAFKDEADLQRLYRKITEDKA